MGFQGLRSGATLSSCTYPTGTDYLKIKSVNSLVVQWLELCAVTAERLRSNPHQGTKILQAVQGSPRKNKILFFSIYMDCLFKHTSVVWI